MSVQLHPVPVATAPLTSAVTYWWNVPRIFRRAEKRYGRFDIVHSNVYADFLLTRRAAPDTRVVTVYHLGSTAAASARLRLASRLVRLPSEYGPSVIAEGVCVKRADHIIAISRFTRDDILRRYPEIEPERVSVIYPGTTQNGGAVVAGEKALLMEDWGISSKEQIALAVGRLEDRKGIPFLLNSFALMPSPAKVKLVLIGDGRPDVCRRIARQLGVADRVVFAGYVDSSTLKMAYGIADVFVHASSMEGFGLVVADAIAVGLPVVATRVGSIPEVVEDGVDGYLVEYGDAKAFAGALVKALNGPLSRQRRSIAPSPAKFTWERTVRETLGLYERLT
jgi:glycosyltransferase involved in cell wall biosynthesis